MAAGRELVEEDARGDAEGGVVEVVVEDEGIGAVGDGAGGGRASALGGGAVRRQDGAQLHVRGVVVIDAAADDQVAGREVIGVAVIGGLLGSGRDCCQSDSENGGGLCQSVDGAAGVAALLHGRLSPLRDTRKKASC